MDKDEKKQIFTINKAIICHYSPFFRAAFNSNFIEGETQSMRLEDVDANTFGLLQHWLYTQKVEDEDDADPLEMSKL